jgi:hypothetical protein
MVFPIYSPFRLGNGSTEEDEAIAQQFAKHREKLEAIKRKKASDLLKKQMQTAENEFARNGTAGKV